jgi:tetratricopeptide (TPR) repeat protein
MNFSDDYFDFDSHSFFDDEKLKSKVKECKQYVSSGQTIAYLNNIEDTIQLCLEYDFTEDGIFLVEAALEISPYSSELWHSKGIFHNNLFDFEQAYKSLEKSLSLNPNDVEAMINKSIAEDNLGYWESAVRTLETALTIEPNNEEAVFNLGILFERNDNFTEAIEYFNRTIYLDKDYSDAWYELGFCYESIGKLEDALKAYNTFLENDPYNASGRYNCGIVNLKMGNNVQAVNCFELATTINENFTNAWYNLGLSFLNLNRLPDAKKSFNRAFELDPFDEDVTIRLAKTCDTMGDNDGALNYYNATLNINQSNIEAYVGRGNCFARRNNFNSALSDFAMIIKFTLVKEIEFDSNFEIESELNNLYEIISVYKEDDNYSSEVLNYIANAYFKLGNWELACKLFRKSIKQHPENSQAHYGKALCMFMMNKNQDAISNLQIAFELNPNTETIFLDKFSILDSTQLYIKTTSIL